MRYFAIILLSILILSILHTTKSSWGGKTAEMNRRARYEARRAEVASCSKGSSSTPHYSPTYSTATAVPRSTCSIDIDYSKYNYSRSCTNPLYSPIPFPPCSRNHNPISCDHHYNSAPSDGYYNRISVYYTGKDKITTVNNEQVVEPRIQIYDVFTGEQMYSDYCQESFKYMITNRGQHLYYRETNGEVYKFPNKKFDEWTIAKYSDVKNTVTTKSLPTMARIESNLKNGCGDDIYSAYHCVDSGASCHTKPVYGQYNPMCSIDDNLVVKQYLNQGLIVVSILVVLGLCIRALI